MTRGTSRLAPLLLALLAPACSEPAVRCDDRGFIVPDPALSPEENSERNRRNIALEERRSKHAIGLLPYATASSLEKAEGCP